MDVAKAIVTCIEQLENEPEVIKCSTLLENLVIEVEKVFDKSGHLTGYSHRTYKIA